MLTFLVWPNDAGLSDAGWYRLALEPVQTNLIACKGISSRSGSVLRSRADTAVGWCVFKAGCASFGGLILSSGFAYDRPRRPVFAAGDQKPAAISVQECFVKRLSSTNLHLGCGLVTPDGWINVDGSWNARLAKWPLVRKLLASLRIISKDHAKRQWSQSIVYHDVRNRFPWTSDSMDAVYQSHLLEHLYRDEAQALLVECFRVLKPRGVLRVVVPDLEAIVQEYVASEASEDAADKMNKQLLFRERSAGRRSLLGIITSFTEFHSHKFMYDGPSLCKYMREAGFGDVAVRECFDSRIEGIRNIERENRAGPGGLCVEGVKPL